jgi:hypothetical protein
MRTEIERIAIVSDGVELLIENGAFCWGNTGSHLAEISCSFKSKVAGVKHLDGIL